MCSILVFAKPDNLHPDPRKQWSKFERGDAIAVQDDDDFFWGEEVHGKRALGWWRVIVLPGVPAAKMQSLAEPEVLEYPALDDAPRKLRAVKIDLDAIEVEAKLQAGRDLTITEKVEQSEPAVLAKVSIKPATAPDGSDVKVTPGKGG